MRALIQHISISTVIILAIANRKNEFLKDYTVLDVVDDNDGADGAGCHRHSMRVSANQGSFFQVSPSFAFGHLGCSLNSSKGAI